MRETITTIKRIIMKELKQKIKTAFDEADSILICAGAGMSADSGVLTFRNGDGFWLPSGPLGKLNMTFEQMSNIDLFVKDPELAWGILGFKTNMFRAATPSQAFHDIQKLAATKSHGSFVVTSNVDNMFQRAGFDEKQIWEIHGSCEWHTSMNGIAEISAVDFKPVVDPETLRLISPLPRVRATGEIARPMAIMFNDNLSCVLIGRLFRQLERFNQWFAKCERPLIITIGAGDTIDSIQRISEKHQKDKKSWLIHIDPDQKIRNLGHQKKSVRLSCGADKGLQTILDCIN